MARQVELANFLITRHSTDIVVSSDLGSWTSHLSDDALAFLEPEPQRDLQWYFEHYAIHDPFAEHRANILLGKLRGFGQALLQTLFSTETALKGIEQNHVLLRVDDTSADGLQILWEILEDVELWGSAVKCHQPSASTVIRVHSASSTPIEIAPGSQFCPSGAEVRHILALTARPSMNNDIPHRLITRSIYDVISKVNAANDDAKSFQIVRPATLKQLDFSLKTRPQLVHLDVHRRWKDDG